VSGELSFGPPKTNASRRTVSMPGFLVKEVVRHLKGFPDRSQLVFASPEGGSIRRTNFCRRFWLPAVDSSVGRPCTFHSFRHTHAALLIGEGARPKVIQERLGHGSIRVTLDTYGHLVEGLDQAAADALDGAFKRSLDSTPTTGDRGGFQDGIERLTLPSSWLRAAVPGTPVRMISHDRADSPRTECTNPQFVNSPPDDETPALAGVSVCGPTWI